MPFGAGQGNCGRGPGFVGGGGGGAGLPFALPTDIANANALGAALSLVHADHVHASNVLLFATVAAMAASPYLVAGKRCHCAAEELWFEVRASALAPAPWIVVNSAVAGLQCHQQMGKDILFLGPPLGGGADDGVWIGASLAARAAGEKRHVVARAGETYHVATPISVPSHTELWLYKSTWINDAPKVFETDAIFTAFTSPAGPGTTVTATTPVGGVVVQVLDVVAPGIAVGDRIQIGTNANIALVREVIAIAGAGPYDLTISEPLWFELTPLYGGVASTVMKLLPQIEDIHIRGGYWTGDGGRRFCEFVVCHNVHIWDTVVEVGDNWAPATIAMGFDNGCSDCGWHHTWCNTKDKGSNVYGSEGAGERCTAEEVYAETTVGSGAIVFQHNHDARCVRPQVIAPIGVVFVGDFGADNTLEGGIFNCGNSVNVQGYQRNIHIRGGFYRGTNGVVFKLDAQLPWTGTPEDVTIEGFAYDDQTINDALVQIDRGSRVLVRDFFYRGRSNAMGRVSALASNVVFSDFRAYVGDSGTQEGWTVTGGDCTLRNGRLWLAKNMAMVHVNGDAIGIIENCDVTTEVGGGADVLDIVRIEHASARTRVNGLRVDFANSANRWVIRTWIANSQTWEIRDVRVTNGTGSQLVSNGGAGTPTVRRGGIITTNAAGAQFGGTLNLSQGNLVLDGTVNPQTYAFPQLASTESISVLTKTVGGTWCPVTFAISVGVGVVVTPSAVANTSTLQITIGD